MMLAMSSGPETCKTNKTVSTFQGRKVGVVSLHKKHIALTDVLAASFDMEIIPIDKVDTDLLGTFSNEIQRTLSPLECLRKKCRDGFEQTSIDLIIATEGSFGPHPYAPFIAMHHELILLADYSQNIEITAELNTTETNYRTVLIENESDLMNFIHHADFPSHGLILMGQSQKKREIIKDFETIESVLESFNALQKKSMEIQAFTDMRAHRNPTRMKQIEQLGHKLVHQMNSICPQCAIPGFSVLHKIRGLACAECGSPTEGVQALQYQCQSCRYSETRKTALHLEDPAHCFFCNP